MPMVEVRNLVKSFPRRAGAWSRAGSVCAVDEVTFTINEGEIFGLVGESGSGKTTTGRCMLRLIEPSSGSFLYRGESVFGLPADRLRALRREIQMVFQDPYASLNPRMRAQAIVEEGLTIHGVGTHAERHARVAELFALVGLDPAHRDRYPHEFSGGQRQRIGLARALALGPSFVVADEPVSALDVSIQAQIINLFLDLQEQLALTLLFIAHDLRLVRHVCARVAVMYCGRIVEMGPTSEVFREPAHPYTRALLSAVPSVNAAGRVTRVSFDASPADLRVPLREQAPGHWAAL
jgi:ABC-type oligopeptide transport system ATPase subunit